MIFGQTNQLTVIRPSIIAGIAKHCGDMSIGFAIDLTMECSLKVDIKTTLRLQKVGHSFTSYLIALDYRTLCGH